ncbi:hypothetical protein FACS189443_7010 [Planctomycetales bacterium]|nr:hypothetical protein FACS189443_7010 [Planctomycetales bacterium]
MNLIESVLGGIDMSKKNDIHITENHISIENLTLVLDDETKKRLLSALEVKQSKPADSSATAETFKHNGK